MNITVVLIGILGIYIGGNWLVAGISRWGRSRNIPQVLIGVTVISLATSVPELLIGIQASLEGADGIVLGTAAGSNIANMGLILGVSGLVAGTIPVASGLVRRGVPIMFGIALIVYGLLFLGELTWPIGVGMLVAFSVFSIYMLRVLRRDDVMRILTTQEIRSIGPLETSDLLLVEDKQIMEQEVQEKINRGFELLRAVSGILLLVVGSNALVQGALAIVAQLGVNQIIIGATFIALVASVPEFFAVMAAANRDQPDVVLGSLVGSSVVNVLLVIGLGALVSPITVDPHIRFYEFPVMLVLMGYLIVVAIDGKLSRWEAGLYGLAYAAFIAGFFWLPL
jgi:cation:H+ antiporter